MQPIPPLVDSSGRQIALAQRLGDPGGEGAVFSVANDSSLAAKIYHNAQSSEKLKKLSAMVALASPSLVKIAAWPKELLFDAQSRQLRGFLMPRIDGCKPIQLLYNPVQRLKYFPRAGWAFQIRAARNLAAGVEEVHKTGCLIGDINERNELVSAQALVWLIDCDSFQVRADGCEYLGDVGVAQYTPPELQGKSLSKVPRTANHDRFGLAVLIYQLLFVGRHPYGGIHSDDAPVEQLIADFRFAQGPAAYKWGMAPPPNTPIFSDLPQSIGELFRRAFEKGGDVTGRPRPDEWCGALDELGNAISKCDADAGHTFWRGVRSCTWCRLAANGGPEYYFGVERDTTTFGIDEAKLNSILQRLAAAEQTDFAYHRADFAPIKPCHPTPLPGQIRVLKESAEGCWRYAVAEREKSKAEEMKQAGILYERLRQYKDGLEQQLGRADHALIQELTMVLQSIAVERKGRRTVLKCLLAATGTGAVGCTLLFVSWIIGAAGALTAFIFGTWLLVYYFVSLNTPAARQRQQIEKKRKNLRAKADSLLLEKTGQFHSEIATIQRTAALALSQHEARANSATLLYRQQWNAEATRRKRRCDAGRESLTAIERRWGEYTAEYLHQRRRYAEIIRSQAERCRSLQSDYQMEYQRLESSAKALACTRHLRLHLISDADIPKVGPGRKQALIAYNVITAADIERDVISRISGFGDVLTGNLLAWKAEILQRFRFDPKTDIATSDQNGLVLKYRNMQQQILANLARDISQLESFAPQCERSLEQLKPELKKTLLQLEQVEADYRLVAQKS